MGNSQLASSGLTLVEIKKITHRLQVAVTSLRIYQHNLFSLQIYYKIILTVQLRCVGGLSEVLQSKVIISLCNYTALSFISLTSTAWTTSNYIDATFRVFNDSATIWVGRVT